MKIYSLIDISNKICHITHFKNKEDALYMFKHYCHHYCPKKMTDKEQRAVFESMLRYNSSYLYCGKGSEEHEVYINCTGINDEFDMSVLPW